MKNMIFGIATLGLAMSSTWAQAGANTRDFYNCQGVSVVKDKRGYEIELRGSTLRLGSDGGTLRFGASDRRLRECESGAYECWASDVSIQPEEFPTIQVTDYEPKRVGEWKEFILS